MFRKSTLLVLLVLIFLSFFGTLILSARMFPQEYDWRDRVISNLLSPRDNPAHYRFAAGGVALSGLLMLPFALHLRYRFAIVAPRMANITAATFIAGAICLICASLVAPQHTHHIPGIRRLHELLGRCAAGFLATGMICGCRCAWLDRRRDRGSAHLLWWWYLATLLPLIGLFCSAASLLIARLAPSWATPIKTVLRGSVFWHLSFWEWMGAAAVFVFLSATTFLTSSTTKRRGDLSL
jgi:hypothetical protein